MEEMIPKSDLGRHKVSACRAVQSNEACLYVIFTYLRLFLVPSTPPVNFTVYSLNSTAIQANWNAPELRNQNGVLKSYQVRYNGSDFDTTERVLNLGIGRISVNLTGLLPDINYCVLIRVKNGAGFSKFSFSSCTRTYEASKICCILERIHTYLQGGIKVAQGP